MPTKFVQHLFSDCQSAEWLFEAVDREVKFSFVLWRIIHLFYVRSRNIHMDHVLQVEKYIVSLK